MNKNPMKSSPKGGKRACLCEDETYSKDCCKGKAINQGIGSLVEQSNTVLVNTNETKTLITNN